ncbi:hypothetical protein SDC9_87155 [bioreactor metagenome]|uniref:Uncharacterized protein n=1 Tax=bioreactor metagenome TaxID=1076179 RepID=A0A644ZKW3_9ZZZZ
MIAGVVRFQRLGQPGPADLGEQRVGDHLQIDISAGVADAPVVAVPGLVAVRIVENDQASGADLVVRGGQHACLDGIGVWRDALGCRNLLDLHPGMPTECLDGVGDAAEG